MRLSMAMAIAVLAACGAADPYPAEDDGPTSCAETSCLAERCEHGEIASCAVAARRLVSSPLRSDRQRAVHLHELGCARDSAADCEALASDLEAGVYTDRDLVRAAALRARMCDCEIAGACQSLASQHD